MIRRWFAAAHQILTAIEYAITPPLGDRVAVEIDDTGQVWAISRDGMSRIASIITDEETDDE